MGLFEAHAPNAMKTSEFVGRLVVGHTDMVFL
jgi:hypothetical protein